MGLGIRTEDEEENGMNVIWVVHMEGRKSKKWAILCCFDNESAANALCDRLNATDAAADIAFYVDDFPLIRVAP